MANRCFKIPQVIVQRGPWNPATMDRRCVSLALHLKERESDKEIRRRLCFRWYPRGIITGEAESQEGPCCCQKASMEMNYWKYLCNFISLFRFLLKWDQIQLSSPSVCHWRRAGCEGEKGMGEPGKDLHCASVDWFPSFEEVALRAVHGFPGKPF